MKIGILTFQNANNYGAVLQAYALQKYLLNNDIDSEFINYNMNANKNISKIKLKIIKLKLVILSSLKIGKIKRIKKFNNFRKKYLKISRKEYYSDCDFYKKKMKYDMIIVGSDQIWNSEITNNSKVFFLNFSKKSKKISYAASVGHDLLTKNEVDNVKMYLSNFDAISVREKSLIKTLGKYTNKKIYFVLDPVFLLNKDKWLKIMQKCDIPKKYIFVYLLESFPLINELLFSINKNSDYEIVYYYGNETIKNALKLNNLGPREFLYVINNAEFIITNSFHGTAFSIILEKKFFTIAHSKNNERIKNILELSMQQNKIINNKTNFSDKMIDGKVAKIELEKYINNSKKFINDNIIEKY